MQYYMKPDYTTKTYPGKLLVLIKTSKDKKHSAVPVWPCVCEVNNAALFCNNSNDHRHKRAHLGLRIKG